MYDRHTHAHSGPLALRALILPTLFSFPAARQVDKMNGCSLVYIPPLFNVSAGCCSSLEALATKSWKMCLRHRHLSQVAETKNHRVKFRVKQGSHVLLFCANVYQQTIYLCLNLNPQCFKPSAH